MTMPTVYELMQEIASLKRVVREYGVAIDVLKFEKAELRKGLIGLEKNWLYKNRAYDKLEHRLSLYEEKYGEDLTDDEWNNSEDDRAVERAVKKLKN